MIIGNFLQDNSFMDPTLNCDHYIGLKEGAGYEAWLTKWSENEILETFDVKFKYYPMCGVQLND